MPTNPDFPDFLALAHAVADQAGAVILPHFRTSLGIDHKGGSDLRPSHGGGPRRRNVDKERACPSLSCPRHRRRGIRVKPSRRGILLGDRSDRRHPRLHLGAAPLGHAGRGSEAWPALARAHGPALHRRAILERRRPKPCFRRHGAERPMRTRPCSSLSEALLASTSPDLFADRGGAGSLRGYQPGRSLKTLRRRLLQLLLARTWPTRPRGRGGTEGIRHPCPDPDHRAGGRRGQHLGGWRSTRAAGGSSPPVIRASTQKQ